MGPLFGGRFPFSLHAKTRIAADNRLGLEQLCRYVARPALAAGRLRLLDTDQLSFALKTPWSDGTTHLLLSPHELLEKLAALVPPPRLNLIRYHGILAPNARDRASIVPGGETSSIVPGGETSLNATANRPTSPVLIVCPGASCWRGCFRLTFQHALTAAGR